MLNQCRLRQPEIVWRDDGDSLDATAPRMEGQFDRLMGGWCAHVGYHGHAPVYRRHDHFDHALAL